MIASIRAGVGTLVIDGKPIVVDALELENLRGDVALLRAELGARDATVLLEMQGVLEILEGVEATGSINEVRLIELHAAAQELLDRLPSNLQNLGIGLASSLLVGVFLAKYPPT